MIKCSPEQLRHVTTIEKLGGQEIVKATDEFGIESKKENTSFADISGEERSPVEVDTETEQTNAAERPEVPRRHPMTRTPAET